ncbi:MAG: hypothetical protein ACI9NT_002505, partial [Bacteroidia bacterium]
MCAVTSKLPSTARNYSPSVDNLRNLLIIRSIALLGQAAV